MKYLTIIIGFLLLSGTAFAATGALSFVESISQGSQTFSKYLDKDTGTTCYVAVTGSTSSMYCMPVRPVVEACPPNALGC